MISLAAHLAHLIKVNPRVLWWYRHVIRVIILYCPEDWLSWELNEAEKFVGKIEGLECIGGPELGWVRGTPVLPRMLIMGACSVVVQNSVWWGEERGS